MATMMGSVKGRARFAAACGVLSRYVKAAAMEAEARPAAIVALPLMPGADVSTTTQEEQQEPGPPQASCASQPQMTIFYGGRVLVLDDVPADRAASVLRLAAAAKEAPRGHGQAVLRAAGDDLPVARKASLQRFMEKRMGRVAARATPYSRPYGDGGACPDARLTLSL